MLRILCIMGIVVVFAMHAHYSRMMGHQALSPSRIVETNFAAEPSPTIKPTAESRELPGLRIRVVNTVVNGVLVTEERVLELFETDDKIGLVLNEADAALVDRRTGVYPTSRPTTQPTTQPGVELITMEVVGAPTTRPATQPTTRPTTRPIKVLWSGRPDRPVIPTTESDVTQEPTTRPTTGPSEPDLVEAQGAAASEPQTGPGEKRGFN